jgi:hypothetical protein
MILFPGHFVPFVFGASAGIMGIFAIFCRLEADAQIRVNFILPIRADVLLWITGAISLFFTLVPSGRGGLVAHAAHLGGLLTGLAWVRLGWHRDFVTLPWESWFARWRRTGRLGSEQRKRELVGATARSSLRENPGRRPMSGEPLSTEEFLSREVDPILDKISQHGIHSLTERERRILDAARKKMGKR